MLKEEVPRKAAKVEIADWKTSLSSSFSAFPTKENSIKSCIGRTKPREKICKDNECKWIVPEGATCSNVNESKNKLAIIMTTKNRKNRYYWSKLYPKIRSFLRSVKNDVNLDNVGIEYFRGSTAQKLDELIESLYCRKNVGYIILIGDEFEKFMEGSNAQLAYDNWYYKFSNVGKEYYTYENGYKEQNPDISCRDVIISWILPPIPYPKQLSDKEKILFISKVIDQYTKYHNNKNNIISQFSGHLHIQWDWKKLGEKEQFEMIPSYVNEDSILILNTEHERISEELRKKPAFFSFFVHGWPTSLSIGLTPDLQNDSWPLYTTVDEFKSMNYKELALVAYTGKACDTNWVKWDEEYNICCWPQVFMDAGVWVQFLGLSNDKVRNVIESPFVGQEIRNINTDDFYMMFGDLTAHL